MKITREQVDHVATLGRLALSEEELEALTGEMDAILDYVEKLNALDTDDIVPTAHAVPVENAFREDEVAPSLGSGKALKNAPMAEGGCFRVPPIIE